VIWLSEFNGVNTAMISLHDFFLKYTL